MNQCNFGCVSTLQMLKRAKYRNIVKVNYLGCTSVCFFANPLYYFVSQDSLQDGNESITVQENTVTSTETVDQTSIELSNGSAIPLVTFRETKTERDSSIEKRDDGCREDCESLHPADLLSFDWQIARGMVSEKATTFVCKGRKKRQRPNSNFYQLLRLL